MKPDRNIRPLSQSERSFESLSESGREHRNSLGWLKVLGGALLIVCLAGGIFVGVALQRHPSTKGAPNLAGWCTSTGAPLHPGDSPLGLTHVVAETATNIWTLGSIQQGDSTLTSLHFAPLLEHWDGTRWSLVDAADVTPLLNNLRARFNHVVNETVLLNDLAVVSANDAWAVGGVIVSPALLRGGVSHTLIEHWDGHSWQLVASPDGSNQGYNLLNGVTVVSANDIWAVGEQWAVPSGSSSRPVPRALVEHWDGKRWSLVQWPAALQNGSLNAIAATSASDIWVTGTATTGGAASDTPLVAHWDGQHWNIVTLPPALQHGVFSSITALAANNVWLVGQTSSHAPFQPLLVHWDGQQWSRVESNVVDGRRLLGITASGARDLWTVGDSISHQVSVQPFIEHWNGQRWDLVTLPGAPYASAASVASAAGKIWIVGNGTDAAGRSTSIWIESMC